MFLQTGPAAMRPPVASIATPGKMPPAAMSLLLLAVGLVACSGVAVTNPKPGEDFDPKDQRVREQFGTIGGGDGFKLSTAPADEAGEQTGGIGVNAYLWRGTLETLDFMPLASADPFGGLIITDWYQSVDAPGERVKLHVLIKDTALRADGLKVSVFRQVADGSGGWLDAPVAPETRRALEDKILTRARELRIQQIGTSG